MAAFIFVEEYEFDWPVTVRYPAAGGTEEREFTARFRLLPDDALMTAPDSRAPADILRAERERLAQLWVGWSGIATEDGAALPFSAETRERLLAQRPVREGVARAYADAVYRGGQREKN